MEEKTIKLELLIDEVNIILNALSNRPYSEVAETINKIRNQGNAQITSEND